MIYAFLMMMTIYASIVDSDPIFIR